MKRAALILMVLFSVILVCFANPVNIETAHKHLILLRTEADEDANAIDLTSAGDFANIPSGAKQLRSGNTDGTGHGGNYVEVFFCGGDANDDTFTYKIYMWRATNGMAKMVATGTGTLGTQAVVTYPSGSTATSKYWADTLTVTGRWLKTVTSTDTSGNNECASIWFDACGYEWIYCEISNADGTTGTEAGDVSAYYSYF